jgi:hypothetical protein
VISSCPQHESLVLFLSSKIHYRTILPNTLREPALNTLKERTTPISRPGIRKIQQKNQMKTSTLDYRSLFLVENAKKLRRILLLLLLRRLLLHHRLSPRNRSEISKLSCFPVLPKATSSKLCPCLLYLPPASTKAGHGR